MQISDKLSKVENFFGVYKHDNGFVVSVKGVDAKNAPTNVNIVTLSAKEVLDLFLEFAESSKL
jgi:hypothetical protein